MDAYIVLVYILSYIGFLATSFYVVNLFSYYKKRSVEQEADDKTVTIIIPAYNEEKSITSTIRSALSLDYPREKLEIIVVNDGSTDRTYEIAKRYESVLNPRVRVFTKPNGGKGTALNVGIKNSTSDIIVSMDADSYVTRSSLKKMVGLFSNPKVMSVTPAMAVHKAKGIWQRIQQIEYYLGVFLRKSFATMNAIHITPGAFSAYRKSFFDKHGGYDEGNITEDLEIALRIQSHHYIIENSSTAAVYTIAPKTFRELMVQRRRWYTGLIRNLWAYRGLFGPRYGALGTIVLPVAVSTIALSVVLTVYMIMKGLAEIRSELLSLNAINFQFDGVLELNSFVFTNFFYILFSQPVFLLAILFIGLLAFYMVFAKKNIHYRESIKLSFILFVAFYSFLFAFWWIISAIFVIFNKKVVWRKNV